MAKISPAKIVRALDTLKGRNSTIFNDPTTFGRSIKVWGWREADYADAKWHLEDAGYEVKVVKTKYGSGRTFRLHISA